MKLIKLSARKKIMYPFLLVTILVLLCLFSEKNTHENYEIDTFEHKLFSPYIPSIISTLAKFALTENLPVELSKSETINYQLSKGNFPLVIAHRGASGYVPEHTLLAYELAIRMGADYIEPDLQLTKDNILVVIHDSSLTRTTNVEKIFPDRAKTSLAVKDFSFKEIKDLDVKFKKKSGLIYSDFTDNLQTPLKIPSFEEVIQLTKHLSKQTGRPIGIYPELKLHDNKQVEEILRILKKYGYQKDENLYIQSLSYETLKSLNEKMKKGDFSLKLVQLGHIVDSTFNGSEYSKAIGGLTCNDYCILTDDEPRQVISLTELQKITNNIGVPLLRDSTLTTENSFPVYTQEFYDYTDSLELNVIGWTFDKSIENPLSIPEYIFFYKLGMNGVFSNYPDVAIKAKRIFLEMYK